jgi:iron complex transport system substrate-binding protein
MRIVSLLPAATEIVCALGLTDALAGISHECAYPPEAVGKPVAMRGVLPVEQMTQAEIDAEVSRRLQAGEPLYEIDAALMGRIAPDLVITQELCEVCAASPKDLAAVLAALERRPRVLRLTPRSLGDILANIAEVGEAVGRADAAAALIAGLRARMDAVRARAGLAGGRPRVFCMEWLDPPYCSGHWVPEMVEFCGGIDALSRKGTDSVRVSWQSVREWAPEVLIVMPCGFGLAATERQAEMLPSLPGWTDLPAVRNGRVYAADANAYFACPGPRVVDGLEMLAHLIHPDLFAWTGPADAFAPLRSKNCARCSAPFLCKASAGCWCEGVSLPNGAAARLACAYADCLCPSCLTAESSQRPPAAPAVAAPVERRSRTTVTPTSANFPPIGA